MTKTFCVVDASNPSQPNDYYYNFKDFKDWSGGRWRSWHSFATIFESEFIPFEENQKCLNYDWVLVLGNKDFKLLSGFIKKLKVLKKKVAFGLHEGFTAFYTMDPEEWRSLKEIVNEVDFYWNLNPQAECIFEGMFPGKKIENIPSAYPFDKWSAAELKSEKKEGILIATRTLQQHFHKRNSFFAIASALAATEFRVPITYINEDGPHIADKLKSFFKTDKLNIIPRNEIYRYWLGLICQHEIVYQLDMSFTHGQVVCDALLMDTPIIGGNNDNQTHTIYAADYQTFDGTNNLLSSYFKYPKEKERMKTQAVYQKDLLEESIGFEMTKYNIMRAFNSI